MIYYPQVSPWPIFQRQKYFYAWHPAFSHHYPQVSPWPLFQRQKYFHAWHSAFSHHCSRLNAYTQTHLSPITLYLQMDEVASYVRLPASTLSSKASVTGKTFVVPKIFILRNSEWFCLSVHNLRLIHAKFCCISST